MPQSCRRLIICLSMNHKENLRQLVLMSYFVFPTLILVPKEAEAHAKRPEAHATQSSVTVHMAVHICDTMHEMLF